MATNWFTAHKDGLRQIAERLVERRGFGIIGAELYQNVMDTTATECIVTIEKFPNRPQVSIIVTDNGEGFADLSHAWTLFAPSLKKSDPSKAGRFNMGEKMVLAFCREARIETTSGTVSFDHEGRTERPRSKRDVGTLFHAILECTTKRMDELVQTMRQIIVRPGLRLVVNGEEIPHRTPVGSVTASLATEISDEEGNLRPTTRKAEIEFYEPLPGETAQLYELGIPVVLTGDKFHYNVLQKVPLNMDRDNVTPSYLTTVRAEALNCLHHQITEMDTEMAWVNEAAGHQRCSADAARTFFTKKFGSRAVAADPFNPEANGEAMSRGFTVIPSHALTGDQRQNLKEHGLLKSSTMQFPNAGKGAYSDDPNAEPVEKVPMEKWSEGMRQIEDYTRGLVKRLIGHDVTVEFVLCRHFEGEPWGACYGRGFLFGSSSLFHYNVARLGRKWFDNGASLEVDRLILHELAHEYESNHVAYEFQQAICTLGAKLKHAVLAEPEWFRSFVK